MKSLGYFELQLMLLDSVYYDNFYVKLKSNKIFVAFNREKNSSVTLSYNVRKKKIQKSSSAITVENN